MILCPKMGHQTIRPYGFIDAPPLLSSSLPASTSPLEYQSEQELCQTKKMGEGDPKTAV